ncbi:MAG: hydrogenase iron-sulfur subunit [Armatimonadetes bacterium]|nr:hydrogenase iron-sulfur subunit [Armatimonadota bacterium]
MSEETKTIESEIEEIKQPKEWQPAILGILCNWCSYAGADLAGSARLHYPESIRIVRVPCSGRVDPMFVLKGFQKGFDAVMVLGCHPGDCHYAKGNYYARRRIAMLQDLLETLGVPRERFHFEWVSASEGNRFAELMTEMTERIKKIGPFDGVTP